MELKPLKNRKSKSQSKKKITSAINLYEKYVDEEILEIKIYTSNYYLFKTNGKDYNVDISKNKVSVSYPDPIWD